MERQPHGWPAFPGYDRPVALVTPPPRPRLGGEVTAQQEKHDGGRDDADQPHNWISSVEHSQNFNRCFTNSCTFSPDGKSGSAVSPLVFIRRLPRLFQIEKLPLEVTG